MLSDRNFTDAAQRVVRHIRERAMDRQMVRGELTEATAGMLAVLSIQRWERKLGRVALEQIADDVDGLARALDSAIESEGQHARSFFGEYDALVVIHELESLGDSKFVTVPSGQQGLVVDMATPVLKLLSQAEFEAKELQHAWVGTEHILLAAVRLACPKFRSLLRQHRIQFEKLREAVLKLLES
jgi:ClpA/ClpB-like protein